MHLKGTLIYLSTQAQHTDIFTDPFKYSYFQGISFWTVFCLPSRQFFSVVSIHANLMLKVVEEPGKTGFQRVWECILHAQRETFQKVSTFSYFWEDSVSEAR